MGHGLLPNRRRGRQQGVQAVSFIDPDLRERWAKEALAKASECKQQGHNWSSARGPCARCGGANPEAGKPRVLLATADLRLVHVPSGDRLVIEKREQNAMGEPVWVDLGVAFEIVPQLRLLLVNGAP